MFNLFARKFVRNHNAVTKVCRKSRYSTTSSEPEPAVVNYTRGKARSTIAVHVGAWKSKITLAESLKLSSDPTYSSNLRLQRGSTAELSLLSDQLGVLYAERDKIREAKYARTSVQRGKLSKPRRQYSLEQFKAVLALDKDDVPKADIARKLDIPYHTLDRWIEVARHLQGRGRRRQNRTYTAQDIELALAEYDKTRSLVHVATTTGISKGTIGTWIRQRNMRGLARLPHTTRNHTTQEIEAAIIKAKTYSTRKEGVQEVAKDLGISTSTMRRWIREKNEIAEGIREKDMAEDTK